MPVVAFAPQPGHAVRGEKAQGREKAVRRSSIVPRNATLAAIHGAQRLQSQKLRQGVSLKAVNKAGAHAVKMEALKQLEYDELKMLRPTQLKDLLEYMDVQSDVMSRKPKNKEEKAEVLEEMVRLVVNRVKLTNITTLHDY